MTSNQPVRSYEKRIALTFGGLVLAAMLIFVILTLILNARTQEIEENRLSATLAETLSEAIGRVSFSGKYQMRLLVQEMQAKIPGIVFIAVDDLDGRLLAHSKQDLNDVYEDDETSDFIVECARSGKAAFREYKDTNRRKIKEVAVPYKGGLYGEVQGVVRAGMDIGDVRAARVTLMIFLIVIGIVITSAAIVLVLRFGRKFGGEMGDLAQQLESIIENSPVAMAVFFRDGKVHRLNRKFIEVFGYSLDDKMNVPDWFPMVYPDPEYRKKVSSIWFEKIEKYRQGKEPFDKMETRVRCKDGSNKIIEFYYEEIGDYCITSFSDVTDRKKAEEERLEMERQVLHVQKLESLGVLAGGVAHDFNNILMAIMGHADIARMRVSADSPAATSLDEIVRASQKASDLSRQMLAYSGRGRFIIEPISISNLIREISQLLSASISKKAKLVLDLDAKLPAVEADATQMRQVIMNLITNASEAIGKNEGIINVHTGTAFFSRADLGKAYLGSDIPEGEYVFLSIKDNGCGMDSDTISRIFEPFFTTKFTGRGLGMSAVLGIIKGHHGAIRIESEPGKGSEFTVVLPPSAGAEVVHAPKTGDWKGVGTILLVDDEESVLKVSRQMLEIIGYRVIPALGGEEAAELYAVNKAEISLVILDLTMPGMDGVETYRRLKEIDSRVRVIISSGYTEEEISARFGGDQPSGFIQKPYSKSNITDILRRVTERTENVSSG
ncbi:MAG TPA: ATP-binding protein [Spirochaetota bacterium]|nr:ATP-binding protein [Spirochaetota bacterium]